MSDQLPENWCVKPLREVADIVNGGTPSRYVQEFWVGGRIPWVTPTDLATTTGRFLSETKDYITESGLQSCSAKLLPAGALLMSSRATVGEIRIAAKEVCTNQGFKNLVPLKGTNGEFLYYQMLWSRERYKALGIGSTFLEVNKRDTERFKIFVAPLPQQQRIAEILSTVDEAIEQTEALIAKTQKIKAGLMHDLFTRGVLPNGKLRPPREEAPQLYKQSPLGWIPKEWEVVAISDAFEIQLGKMLSKASKTGNCSARYIGNRAVQWDRVDLSNLEEMDFPPSERRKYALAAGDLLVCEGGDVGRTAMWHGEVSECFYQKAIHRLRPSNGLALPEYMLRYMRYFYDSGGFYLFTSQSSIAHLTREKLAVVPLRLPPMEEQVLLADRFMAIDQRVETEANEKKKIETIKRGLMHDLLTGRVRIEVDCESRAMTSSLQNEKRGIKL